MATVEGGEVIIKEDQGIIEVATALIGRIADNLVVPEEAVPSPDPQNVGRYLSGLEVVPASHTSPPLLDHVAPHPPVPHLVTAGHLSIPSGTDLWTNVQKKLREHCQKRSLEKTSRSRKQLMWQNVNLILPKYAVSFTKLLLYVAKVGQDLQPTMTIVQNLIIAYPHLPAHPASALHVLFLCITVCHMLHHPG